MYRKKVNELAYTKRKLDAEMYRFMIQIGYGVYIGEILHREPKPVLQEEENRDWLIDYVGRELITREEKSALIRRLNVKKNGRLLKSAESLNAALAECHLPYWIEVFNMNTHRNGKKYRKKGCWRIVKIE